MKDIGVIRLVDIALGVKLAHSRITLWQQTMRFVIVFSTIYVFCLCVARVRMSTEDDTGYEVVVVTGGAGFLGQHVVKLLQLRADHVMEIRVVDIQPYRQRLGQFTSFTSFTSVHLHFNHSLNARSSPSKFTSFTSVHILPFLHLSEPLSPQCTSFN